jgi:hypothetical protein
MKLPIGALDVHQLAVVRQRREGAAVDHAGHGAA